MVSRRFLIVGGPRSGTTATMMALYGHPDTSLCGDEVKVAPFFTRGSATFTCGHESLAERSRRYGSLFDAMTRGPDDRSFAHGLKVAVNTHDMAMDLANCLREHLRDVYVVLVRREDLVAQFASLQRASKTGVWHSWQSTGRDDLQLTIAKHEFANYARQNLRVTNQLRTLQRSHPLLEITYEADVAQQRFKPLFSFLGLDACEPDWLTMKKVAPPARDYVTNYDELQQLLAGLELPDTDAELDAASVRLERQEQQEAPAVLFEAAKSMLDANRPEEAERLAFYGLMSESEMAPSLPQKGFQVLEAAWREIGDADRALGGLRRLEPCFADDSDWLLLAGVVRCHSGHREQGLADLARAAAVGNVRARSLLAVWPSDPE